MLRGITLIAVILFLYPCLWAQEKIGKYFNDYYDYAGEITPEKDILIGDITFIDFYGGKILIADQFGKNVYLLDSKGNLLKKLNPDECHPGVKWLPYRAYFNKKGDILVMNNYPPWGFRFNNEGKCIGPVSSTFVGAFNFTFRNDNSIICYNQSNKNNRNSLIMMDEKGKELKEFGIFPDEYKNIISRRMAGGLIVDDKDNLYQLNVSSYEITKYDKNLNYVKTLKCRPDKYVPPPRDYTASNNMEEIMRDSKHFREFTSPERLYLLDKNVIAVEYWTKGILELTLCDLEGNRLNKNPINYEKIKSLNAKNGYLYFVQQPKPEKGGDYPNPIIKIYKYKKAK